MTEPTTQTLVELRKLAEAASALDHNERLKWYTEDELLPSAIYPKNARYMAALTPPKVIELLDALEAQAREIERLQKLVVWNQEQREIDLVAEKKECDQLRAELAAIRAAPVAIPADVMEAAKSMQKDHYRGPLAWAVKVINFVADYASPVADVNAGLVELPKEDTEEANKAITSMLAEYQYPANPQNAGRAGWRAARLYTARTQQAPKGGE